MTSTNYPDHLTPAALNVIEGQVSDEIAQTAAPTSALLDGTALERRNRRIASRALKGITAQYGVTLAQAVRESEEPAGLVTASTIPAPVFGATKRVGRKARRAAARRANLGQVA